MKPDYYKILGVSPNAPDKEIRRVYHQLASKYHPDKARTPEEAREFEERFAQISEAYNVLKDPERRREYDKTLKETGAASVETASITTTQSVETTKRTAATGKVAAAPSVSDLAAIAQRAFNKGLQFYKTGDYARAVQFFEASVQNMPKEANYLSYLALALVKSRKELTRAIELCKKAIELEPFNMEHRLRLGMIYETMGSVTMARKTYEEILRWDNSIISAQERLQALSKKKKTLKTIIEDILGRFKKH